MGLKQQQHDDQTYSNNINSTIQYTSPSKKPTYTYIHIHIYIHTGRLYQLYYRIEDDDVKRTLMAIQCKNRLQVNPFITIINLQYDFMIQ